MASASTPLIDRLSAHRTIGGVPRDQLAWLASTGIELTLQPGDILTPSTGPVKGLYVVLDGHLSISVDRGAGPRIVMEWHGGDVTGILPYSRIKAPPGNVVAEEPTGILMIAAAEVPRLILECHELTAVLVHVMVDRARVFKSSELLDEKMISLGRLAAGLAHELNNPASAVARSAKTLGVALPALDEATRRFFALDLSEAQRAGVAILRDERISSREKLAPLALADRQDALEARLNACKAAGIDAAPLAQAGFRPEDVDAISGLVGSDQLAAVFARLAAELTMHQLVSEIDTAATRIHSLVAAVKGFTYVNQQATLQPVGIGRGLADTITVLKSKARTRAVTVDVHVADDLPPVDGYGGELNQVWANLIDNAIDATPGGHVKVDAGRADNHVVVRVIDDGPGIPADVLTHVFDPFFTTKEVGEGTGLGLDIARRIVQRHHGAIDVHTGPAGTEFRVTLPVSAATGGARATPA